MELVRFDFQQMEQPDITGIQYQQGELLGYEVREYLLEKWNRTCAYCDATGVPLQVEHIVPRASGGTNRVSNLTLACEPCNRRKGTQSVSTFLAEQPARLARVLAQAKAPLKDAAAVNSTRWELWRRLQATGLPVETGSGGRTKYNRRQRELPKTHWLDAACVGASTPETLHIVQVVPLQIQAVGHGRRKMCNTNDLGFPISHRKRRRRYFGYQTGDMIRAVVPEAFAGRGTHVGKVSVRASGTFAITTAQGRIESIPQRFFQPVGRNDGYRYQKGMGHSSPA